MQVSLDNVNFTEIFSAAILQNLDAAKKDELIKGAVQYLLTPKDSSYGSNKRTPMQDAFYDAMRQQAQKSIAEYIEKDEQIKGVIQGLVKDAVERIFTNNREQTVVNIADKIIEGLYRDKY